MGDGSTRSASVKHGVFAALGLGAVVLVTAGVVAPLTADDDVVLRADALRQAQVLGAAVRDFLRDCGTELREHVAEPPQRLYGPGVQPDVGGLARLTGFPLSAVLCRDDLGLGAAWKGPYLDRVPIDPWGRAWIVHLPLRSGDGDAWVVSAGDDGVVDTALAGGISPRDAGVALLN